MAFLLVRPFVSTGQVVASIRFQAQKSSFARGPAPRSSTRPSQRLGRWGWRRIGGARRRRRWRSSPPGQVSASIRFRAQNSSGALGGALLSLSEVVASSWTLEQVADRWRTAAAALALDERALRRVVARRVRSSSPRSIRAASRAAGVVHLVPKPRRASAASSARPLGRTRERFGQSHRCHSVLLSRKPGSTRERQINLQCSSTSERRAPLAAPSPLSPPRVP